MYARALLKRYCDVKFSLLSFSRNEHVQHGSVCQKEKGFIFVMKLIFALVAVILVLSNITLTAAPKGKIYSRFKVFRFVSLSHSNIFS